MASPFTLFGRVRGGGSSTDERAVDITENRDLFVAQGQAPFSEMARAGGIWNCIGPASAPVVVQPSTTAMVEIYNQLSSGIVLEVLDVFVFELLTTNAEHCITAWAQVSPQRGAVAPPTLAALLIGSQSGRMPYTSTANSRIVTATGTAVVANGWRPFSYPVAPFVSTGVLPMIACSYPVNGQMIVPPGASLCLQVTDTLATGSSVQVGASWNEKPMPFSVVM